jgi:hypothetical protein
MQSLSNRSAWHLQELAKIYGEAERVFDAGQWCVARKFAVERFFLGRGDPTLKDNDKRTKNIKRHCCYLIRDVLEVGCKIGMIRERRKSTGRVTGPVSHVDIRRLYLSTKNSSCTSKSRKSTKNCLVRLLEGEAVVNLRQRVSKTCKPIINKHTRKSTCRVEPGSISKT